MAKDAYLDSEKTAEIELRVPFMTNGKVLSGKVSVPASVADDLLRRQHEYEEDQRRMLRNNGENIDAAPGGIKG